ncbi:MAG: thiamine phosphate synthase [Candidatus Schekmanbacteria bacterium]|nr:thiamine phosphate synthase [Candidatus Schekmanbacteria bacterium]
MQEFKLYFVADIKSNMKYPPLQLIEMAVAGGVDIVQLRYKEENIRFLLDLGQKIQPILKAKNIPLIINDRLDVAQILDADGVHLGQEDIPPIKARQILGANKIIGLSTHSLEQAKAAQNEPIDYLAVGPVFSTNTKKMASPPLGTAFLTQIAGITALPWLIIGGINSSNLADVIAAGAKRIAVVSAISEAEDVTLAARTLKKMLENKLV